MLDVVLSVGDIVFVGIKIGKVFVFKYFLFRGREEGYKKLI